MIAKKRGCFGTIGNNVSELLEYAEELKIQVTQQASYNNSASMNVRQQLQNVYHDIILQDLDYAIDKKVDVDLWNHVFRQHITIKQHDAKDRKNAKRAEAQAGLTSFLEASNAFYLLLLHELCYKFKLKDTIGFADSRTLGLFASDCNLDSRVETLKNTPPKRTSFQYIIQDSLIHLGDIARYRNSVDQAKMFYEQAIVTGPSNGRPYNQIAILLQNKPNYELSTIYYFVRSLTVKHAFVGAVSNLNTTLNKILQMEEIDNVMISCSLLTCSSEKGGSGENVCSLNSFTQVFCYFASLVFLRQDLDSAIQAKDFLIFKMFQVFHKNRSSISWKLPVQIVYVCIFNFWCLTHTGDTVLEKFSADTSLVELNDLNVLDRSFLDSMIDFIAALLGSLLKLLANHSPTSNSQLFSKDSLLHALKILMEWISQVVYVLDMQAFDKRQYIWPSLVKVLNYLTQCDLELNMSDSESAADNNGTRLMKPLIEDFEVQGFMPLRNSLSKLVLPCHLNDVLHDGESDKRRVERLVLLGEKFCELKPKMIEVVETKGRLCFETTIILPANYGESNEERPTFKGRANYSKNNSKLSLVSPVEDTMSKNEEMSSNQGIKLNEAKIQLPQKDLSVDKQTNQKGRQNSPSAVPSKILSVVQGINNGDKSRNGMSKNVTFGNDPPKTIDRTPSPNKGIDLSSENDFPILTDGRRSEHSNFNRQHNVAMAGGNAQNIRFPAQGTGRFSSPGLAMSFPGFQMKMSNNGIAQCADSNKVTSPPGAPRYSQQKREPPMGSTIFPISNAGIIGSGSLAVHSMRSGGDHTSSLFPSAVSQPGLFPPFPPPPPLPPLNETSPTSQSHLSNFANVNHVAAQVANQKYSNQFSPFGQNGLFGAASFHNTSGNHSTDQMVGMGGHNLSHFIAPTSTSAIKHNQDNFPRLPPPQASGDFANEAPRQDNTNYSNVSNLPADSLFPSFFNNKSLQDTFTSTNQKSFSMESNSGHTGSSATMLQRGNTMQSGLPPPGFGFNAIDSKVAKSSVMDKQSQSVPHVLFGGSFSNYNSHQKSSNASLMSSFDSIWSNSPVFSSVNSNGNFLFKTQHGGESNLYTHNTPQSHSSSQNSANLNLFQNTAPFQSQRSCPIGNAHAQEKIPDLMSLETKSSGSKTQTPQSSTNQNHLTVSSLFENAARHAFQRQNSDNGSDSPGNGSNKLLAGLFCNMASLDVGKSYDSHANTVRTQPRYMGTGFDSNS